MAVAKAPGPSGHGRIEDGGCYGLHGNCKGVTMPTNIFVV